METKDTVVLKKYASRRLYNPEDSTYVTLAQVADLIRGGQDIQVFDAKTKEDVTAFILTQILLEEARNKSTLLPAPLLHLIIRSGGKELQEFFDKHLQQAINTYLQYKKAFDEQFSVWINTSMNFSEMAHKTFSGLSPFQGPPPKPDKPAPEEKDRRKKG